MDVQLPKRKIGIASYSISAKTGIPTLQTSQQFNETTFQNGGTPRPRYKFTRLLGGEICNQKRPIALVAITDEPPTGSELDYIRLL